MVHPKLSFHFPVSSCEFVSFVHVDNFSEMKRNRNKFLFATNDLFNPINKQDKEVFCGH